MSHWSGIAPDPPPEMEKQAIDYWRSSNLSGTSDWKDIKDAEQELEKKVLTKYPALSLDEVKNLVVERKWMDALQSAVEGEVDRLSQQLAGRIKELAERYSETLPVITEEVDEYTAKVDAHLKKMGYSFEK